MWVKVCKFKSFPFLQNVFRRKHWRRKLANFETPWSGNSTSELWMSRFNRCLLNSYLLGYSQHQFVAQVVLSRASGVSNNLQTLRQLHESRQNQGGVQARSGQRHSAKAPLGEFSVKSGFGLTLFRPCLLVFCLVHFRTLRFLLKHLNVVSQKGQETGMTAKNLVRKDLAFFAQNRQKSHFVYITLSYKLLKSLVCTVQYFSSQDWKYEYNKCDQGRLWIFNS